MDNEFLLFLNSEIITSNYSNEFIDSIMKFIKDYCKAEQIILIDSESQRKGDYRTGKSDVQIKDNDFIINIWESEKKLIIRGKKREFQNDNFFKVSLSITLGILFKNKKIIETLKREKYIDSLLNIFNRRAYDELLKNHKKSFINVGILFVDANGLGILNNMYGYQKGDELLKAVADSLKSNFRISDIYRIGGDEFVVICESIDKNLFNTKVELSKKIIEKSEFTASFGLVYKESTLNIESDIEEASVLMKRSKEEYREAHPEKYLDKYKVKLTKK